MAAHLNPAQHDAVNTLSGPMLVLAGAGTGKTRVVTFRIAKLIKNRVRPARILAVTFTNKAAAEMQERIGELLGKKSKDAERPVVSTFHSHCLRILRRHIRRLGYPEKFAIYDRGDQESLARAVLREIRVPETSLRPGEMIHLVSGWKSKSMAPTDATRSARTDKEHLASMAYRRYQKALKNAGAVDFDDLLLCTEQLFREHEDVLTAEAAMFDHLLVDEYQDTNGSQYRIVKALAGAHRNLCVVGDDDQSIYAWRGAQVEHILGFAKDWPEAKIVRLEDNYRCTSEILELANRLIVFNKKRHDKVLRAARRGGEKPKILQFKDENAEASEIVADIRRRIELSKQQPKDFAILFRTNEQPRAFETELRRVKLPYILLGGQSFFDRKEVRDILAYLRVVESPRDEVSLLRIINSPPRGIGQKTVETLIGAAVSAGKPVWDVMRSRAAVGSLPANARTAIEHFVTMILGFRQQAADQSMSEFCRGVIRDINYESELRRLYNNQDDIDARWSSVEEVVNAISAYESQANKPTLFGFLDDCALGGREFDNEKEKQLRRDAIALMTLHSAKGLEFPQVYMVGMEEGILPHHRSVAMEDEDSSAIDEERRLCYVGITRAQDRLTLSMPLTRMKWGKPRDTIPSRFLWEITGQADNPQAIAQRQQAIRDAIRQKRRKPQKSATKKRKRAN